MKKRTFWQRVEEAMTDAGHKPTQGAVAELIGIKQPSVSKWTKAGKPSIEHVVILAGKLKVCVEWLYTERGPKRPLDAESSELLDLFTKLPQRQRDRVMAYIDGLVDRGPEPEPPRPRPNLS